MGAVRALRRDDLLDRRRWLFWCIKWGSEYPERHDLSARPLGTVGEPINPKAWLWYHKVIGGGRRPIVDTWWQTETGGIMITTLPGILDTKPGSAGRPLPGISAAVVDEQHDDAGTEQGFLTLEWPGMLRTIYKEDDRFIETYESRTPTRSATRPTTVRILIGRIDDVLRLGPPDVDAEYFGVGDRLLLQGRRGRRDRPADEDTGQTVTALSRA